MKAFHFIDCLVLAVTIYSNCCWLAIPVWESLVCCFDLRYVLYLCCWLRM